MSHSRRKTAKLTTALTALVLGTLLVSNYFSGNGSFSLGLGDVLADSSESLATPRAEMLAKYLQDARRRTAALNKHRGRQNPQLTESNSTTPTLTATEQEQHSEHIVVAQQSETWRHPQKH